MGVGSLPKAEGSCLGSLSPFTFCSRLAGREPTGDRYSPPLNPSPSTKLGMKHPRLLLREFFFFPHPCIFQIIFTLTLYYIYFIFLK